MTLHLENAARRSAYEPPREAPIVVAVAIGILMVAGTIRAGLAPVVIIGGSAVIAYLAWLKTTYRNPANPNVVLPPYLLLLAAELVHMAEEYLMDFPGEMSDLFGLHGFTLTFFTVGLVMIGGSLGLLSGFGLIHYNVYANYFVWFVVIGPGMVNAVAHIALPAIAGQWYFPGLATVVLPTAAGIYTIAKLIEHRPTQQPQDPDVH